MPKVVLTEEKRIEAGLLADLYTACRLNHIRQKHIAAELGLSQAAVSKMMSGETAMSLEHFIQISLMAGRNIEISTKGD